MLGSLLANAVRMDFEQLQLEAIWCLTNVASDSEGLVEALVNAQILPVLKSILFEAGVSDTVKEQVIWCYGNISGETTALRDAILADNVVPAMTDVLDRAAGDSSLVRNVAWCLSNFMKGDPLPALESVAPAVPSLIRALLRTSRDDVINDIIWGLSYFTQTAQLEALQCLLSTDCI